jgi:signal transduction histidine kinase
VGPIAVYGCLILVNGALAGMFGQIGNRTMEQNREHRRVIAELNEANERLELALRENIGLHAQLVAQAREAGVLDERQRLAGEIHDTLAQGLTGIVTQLEAAEQARHLRTDWQRHISQARSLARESLAQARRSVRALRPEQLEDAGLPDAITGLARRWAQAATSVALSIDITGDPRQLPADVEAALFRVAQEALTNVAKHAQAFKVRLTLSYLDDVVLLDVRDDGVGFDPAASPRAGSGCGSGFGLDAMRQRLRRVDGTLEVESAPGEGTALSACVPAVPVAAALTP